MKLSIIIPVYNVEKYLEICLEAVCHQSFRDFEVILVDDGSTDTSSVICDEAAKQDKRIRVIHQKNQGLSAARNAGLDIAQGEWIGFVDSDDYSLPEMYEKLLNAAEKNHADIAMCNFLRVDVQNQPIEKQEMLIPDGVLNQKEALQKVMLSPFHVAVNKVYRRRIFDALRYREGKLNEDLFIVTAIYDRVERVACLSEPLYAYRVTPGSIMQKKKTLKNYDAVEAADTCFQYFYQKKENQMLELCEMKAFDSLRRVYYGLNKQERRAPETKAAKAIHQRELKAMRERKRLDFKTICRSFLFNFSPMLYKKLWNGK